MFTNVKNVTTVELQEVYEIIKVELERRYYALQETCKHPEWVEIMYMRPGAFYTGCKVCQAYKTDSLPECVTVTNTTSDDPVKYITVSYQSLDNVG